MSNNTTAVDILNKAMDAVSERAETHGDPTDVHQLIADFWCSYLNAKNVETTVITALDVLNMMELLKIARSAVGDEKHEEHYGDRAGYAALAGEIACGGDDD